MDSDYETQIRNMPMNWPRFLLVESGDDSLPVTKLSPLPLIKVSRPWFQEDWDHQATQKWNLLSGVWHKKKTEWSSPQIPKISWLANESQYSPNPELLAWCHSLPWSSWHDWNGHVRDELSEQGVTLVKRVRREDQGQEKDTNTIFLTFCNANLPKDISIGYLRVKVDPFIPNPLHYHTLNWMGLPSKWQMKPSF